MNWIIVSKHISVKFDKNSHFSSMRIWPKKKLFLYIYIFKNVYEIFISFCRLVDSKANWQKLDEPKYQNCKWTLWKKKKKTVEYIASAAIKNIYICGVVEMLRDLCSTSNWCCTFLSWTQMDMIKKTCITFCQVISPSDRKKNTRKSCTLLYLTNAFIFVVAKQMDERRKKKKRHETNMTVHL